MYCLLRPISTALRLCKTAVALLHGISILERLPASDILPAWSSRVLVESISPWSEYAHNVSRTVRRLEYDGLACANSSSWILPQAIHGIVAVLRKGTV